MIRRANALINRIEIYVVPSLMLLLAVATASVFVLSLGALRLG
ncbi:MAG: hypothetical protein AAB426_09565 [Myxococcota bacterium]